LNANLGGGYEPFGNSWRITPCRVLTRTRLFCQTGARMYPKRINSIVLAVAAVTILAAVAAPPATAHGGGGGHGGHAGAGGGHAGGGASAGAPNGGYSHASPNSQRYGAWSYPGRASGAMSSQPVWEGFPEDLPFARLQRFVAGHLPHWHLPFRHVS
jgi:hypothetical protein